VWPCLSSARAATAYKPAAVIVAGVDIVARSIQQIAAFSTSGSAKCTVVDVQGLPMHKLYGPFAFLVTVATTAYELLRSL
jgi:hypothetical protein